jgi:hypothetical protein
MVLPVVLCKVAMRYTIILVLILTACATRRPQEPPALTLTLEQLRMFRVTQADCAQIETLIPQLEANQTRAGVPRMDPMMLPPAEREYQARTRAAIWALRIGCENPDRYVAK